MSAPVSLYYLQAMHVLLCVWGGGGGGGGMHAYKPKKATNLCECLKRIKLVGRKKIFLNQAVGVYFSDKRGR